MPPSRSGDRTKFALSNLRNLRRKPLIVAQELLKGEGSTQLQAVKKTTGIDGINRRR